MLKNIYIEGEACNRNVVRNIREANYGVKIFTHTMVGFSSETEGEFQETLSVIKDMRCDNVVVFPCHEKKHTPAAGIEGKLPAELINSRTAEAFKFFKHHS